MPVKPGGFPGHLNIERRWHWNGQHYAKTLNTWLKVCDENEEEIMPVLAECYGEDNASLWWMRWRIFFMACAELFALEGGREWYVSHYRFRRAEDPREDGASE